MLLFCYNILQILTFVITFAHEYQHTHLMNTTVNIIRIGNSLGVILPSKILKRLELREKDTLSVSLTGEAITLTSPDKSTSLNNPFSAISKGGWYGMDETEASELSDFLHDSRVDGKKEIVL